MSRTARIVFGSLIIAATAVGYGVYWWYGAASQVEPPPGLDVTGADREAASRVHDLLLAKEPGKEKEARSVLDSLPRDRKVVVLSLLAAAKEAKVRKTAAAWMTPLAGVPEIRALLVKLLHDDKDRGVRDAAAEALREGG